MQCLGRVAVYKCARLLEDLSENWHTDTLLHCTGQFKSRGLRERGRFHSLMGRDINSPSRNVVYRKRLYSTAFEMYRSLAFSDFAELYTRTFKILM